MRIYLDNCCYNRPYDDQSQDKIEKETASVLLIQQKISEGKVELVRSYILDYENSCNPFPERRNSIAIWDKYSQIDISESSELLEIAEKISRLNISSKDSLHVASAIIADCKYFITTDEDLITKLSDNKLITVLNPIEFTLKKEY